MPAHIQSHHASHSPYKNKIVSAAEAVQLIHDGDTVATGGFVGIGFAEAIAVALEERYVATQQPRDLAWSMRLDRAMGRREASTTWATPACCAA
jgi:acyl CoA:acetate/3-ketoacid CoA transferase